MRKELVGRETANGADNCTNRRIGKGHVDFGTALLNGCAELRRLRVVEYDLDMKSQSCKSGLGTRDTVWENVVQTRRWGDKGESVAFAQCIWDRFFSRL